jgi:drug/metabolite transporter (DMT)-like permease
MNRLAPIVFVILWSSAFISSKVIVDNASPFAALSLRFFIVSIGFFIFAMLQNTKIIHDSTKTLEAIFSGILFHGLYLGGVFYAISIGMPASVAALIVSMQPVLTNIFAGPILNESVTWKQWVGIIFGFTGSFLVLGFDIGGTIPIIGVIASILALIAATTATLWQKKISTKLPLAINNFYQAVGASIFLLLVMIFFENSFIFFNLNFFISMSWQIIVISFGAFTILMYLIKIGTASRTSNLFFLVPSISALMAWLVLDEIITPYDVIGLFISSFGVFIATRKNNSI